MKTINLFMALVLVAGLALSVAPVQVAHAATPIYVRPDGDDVNCDGTTNDPYLGGGPGLNCAVKTIQQGITLVDDDGTVYVAAGTYTENVTINKSLTLAGAGEASTTVDGGGSDRVFLIGNTDPSVNVTISDMKIQNGGNVWWGGGIMNYATLTLTNSSVSGNEADNAAGGICNRLDATLTLNNCTVSGNSATFGAGIYSWGTVELTNCTVSGNEGEWDGGIYNDGGTAKLTSSTVSDNSAGLGGGICGAAGIYNRYGTLELTNCTVSDNIGGPHTYSGGITNYQGTVALNNCTVSGNSAGSYGGINNQGGTVALNNSTVSGNEGEWCAGNWYDRTMELTNCTVSDNNGNDGGGIYNRGTVELTNNIVAAQASGADCAGDPITSLGHNLDSDGTCVTDGVNDDITNATPGLGPLQDNGGPTETHALLPSSPAIDAIPVASCPVSTDQRGVARPQPTDGNCDIGAYEYEPPTAITLASFTAQVGADGVTLAWETGTEINNAGFNLYRAMTKDGPYTKVNDALFAAQGDAVAGASYSFLDTSGYGTFYYKLEDVDYHGVSTLHGPVKATVARPFRRPLYRPRLPR